MKITIYSRELFYNINMLPCLLVENKFFKHIDKEKIRNGYTIFPSMFIRKKNKLLDFKNE